MMRPAKRRGMGQLDQPLVRPSVGWMILAGVITGMATAAYMYILLFRVMPAAAEEEKRGS